MHSGVQSMDSAGRQGPLQEVELALGHEDEHREVGIEDTRGKFPCVAATSKSSQSLFFIVACLRAVL